MVMNFHHNVKGNLLCDPSIWIYPYRCGHIEPGKVAFGTELSGYASCVSHFAFCTEMFPKCRAKPVSPPTVLCPEWFSNAAFARALLACCHAPTFNNKQRLLKPTFNNKQRFLFFDCLLSKSTSIGGRASY